MAHKPLNYTRRKILKIIGGFLSAPAVGIVFKTIGARAGKILPDARKGGAMNLPPPSFDGSIPLERTIKNRRTVRAFASKSLTTAQFAQLLWAAQGITQDGGYLRAAPSAGALYPMDVYAVVGENGVEGVEAGIFHYDPLGHAIARITDGDRRKDVARAALSQMWMAQPPLNLVLTAEYDRITGKYGRRGVRYAMIEAGHAGQNIFLQAEALGLGAGIVGAFYDEDLIRVMKIPGSHTPLLVMPVGYKK